MTNKVQRYQAKNLRDKEQDPCFIEREQSLECLVEYESSRSICEKHIVNYKVCKDFWVSVQAYRSRRQIWPALPPPEERDKIKAEFFEEVRSRSRAAAADNSD